MTDPVQTPKRLYRKAARGKDEESMPIVLGGVMLVVTLVRRDPDDDHVPRVLPREG